MSAAIKPATSLKSDQIDERLPSLPPEFREHFKESMRHNRRVLKQLAKM